MVSAREFDWSGVRRVMFVCHGNICRSPMAESVLVHLLEGAGVSGISVCSSATSTEEIGEGIHPGALRELRRRGVPAIPHHAVQLQRADAEKYDVFLGMDEANVRNMTRILGDRASGKCFKLLDFTVHPRAIADPWYTGEFEETWCDILEGCQAIAERLKGCASDE